jgi:hypothetical protein
MSTNGNVVKVIPGNSTLLRPCFSPGQTLRDDDLNQGIAYTRDLSRLLFRSLIGCGVVCGLVVKIEPPQCGKQYITVESGLALDSCGDPVYVPQPQRFALDEACVPNLPSRLWIVLCGIEKSCAPRTATCSYEETEASSVCTRERDGFEIRVLRARPACVCGCDEPKDRSDDMELCIETDCKCVNPEHPCYKDHYQGKCGCDCAENSDCNCDCILLARLDYHSDNEFPYWAADHSVRRFIRPVLMRDPQVEAELATKGATLQTKEAVAESTSRKATPDQTKGKSQRKGQPNVGR